MKIFSGSINNDFAENVCNRLGESLAKIKINNFKDGETKITVEESIRQEDCFVIQPTCRSETKNVNDAIVELLIIIDALKRGSAKSVNVVIPYFGYQRQDRKDYSRAPISAKVIASCLESQNINRIIVYDLHAGQISGFFSNNCPLDNLYVEPYFIKYIENEILKGISIDDLMIVSPDEGGVKTNTRVASKLGCDAATIFKNRNKDCVIDTMRLMGDVTGKNVIMIDDILDTGGTACKACELLKKHGAKNVYFMASHGLLSGNALENISNSSFTKVILTNTVPHREAVLNHEKIHILDVSWLCSEAIRRVQVGQSLKDLYESNPNIYAI
jgi:ribose-phosphate pyrophosphokinase